MKRLIIAMILGILLMSSLVAGAEAQIVLKYWRHNYEPANELDQMAIAEFEKKHPNVKVEMTIVSTTSDLNQKFLTAVVGGIGPDVINVNSAVMPVFVDRGTLVPIVPESFGVATVDELTRQWLPGSLEGYTYNGKLYGIPSEMSAYAFWINREHFREAGVDPDSGYPRSWQDVAEVGKKLTKFQMGRISRQGYVQRITSIFPWQAVMNQLGGKVIDGDRSFVNSPEIRRSLKIKQDFVLKHEISDPSTQVDPLELFGTGQASMNDYGGSWYVSILERDYPETSYKVVPYPRVENAEVDTGGTVYGYAQAVYSGTRHSELAWELVNALSAHPERYIGIGLFQPRKGWFETPEAQNFPDFDLWSTELAKGVYHLRSTHYNEINQILLTALERALQNQDSVDEVLSDAHREVQGVLSR